MVEITPAMKYFNRGAGLLFLFLHLLSSAGLSAQGQFAPVGAEWCFSGFDGEGAGLGYLRVNYERDTVVRGTPTKVFSVLAKGIGRDGLSESYFSPVELFQQSGDSIFYYIPIVRSRVFLFKERYREGEETTTWLYNEPFRVHSVEELLISEAPVTVSKMNLLDWLGRDLPVTMYEGIGPDRGFTESWSYFLEGQGGLRLEAYRATDVPEIKIVARSDCFSQMAYTDDRVPAPVPLDFCNIIPYPNPIAPAAETVRIRFDCGRSVAGAYLLEIYDASGRRSGSPLRVDRIPYDVPVQSLSGGFYRAVLSGEGKRFNFSFFKSR